MESCFWARFCRKTQHIGAIIDNLTQTNDNRSGFVKIPDENMAFPAKNETIALVLYQFLRLFCLSLSIFDTIFGKMVLF